MPFATSALGTAAAVKGRALEEGAAQDIAATRERGSKLILGMPVDIGPAADVLRAANSVD